eukprot:4356652-Ditylum_brightwellii.AAC.1
MAFLVVCFSSAVPFCVAVAFNLFVLQPGLISVLPLALLVAHAAHSAAVFAALCATAPLALCAALLSLHTAPVAAHIGCLALSDLTVPLAAPSALALALA